MPPKAKMPSAIGEGYTAAPPKPAVKCKVLVIEVVLPFDPMDHESDIYSDIARGLDAFREYGAAVVVQAHDVLDDFERARRILVRKEVSSRKLY
tara:strand:- start:3313 stop:3594 length:282 start_codon:yes stop_codon:yes gene_type:complete